MWIWSYYGYWLRMLRWDYMKELNIKGKLCYYILKDFDEKLKED